MPIANPAVVVQVAIVDLETFVPWKHHLSPLEKALVWDCPLTPLLQVPVEDDPDSFRAVFDKLGIHRRGI